MRIDILTIFPEMFPAPLGSGILRLAAERAVVEIHVHDLRDYTADRRRSIDDRPYGGGPGMVMMPGPVFQAVESVERRHPRPGVRVLLTPQGERFGHALAERLAAEERLLLICGRYEGFDERIRLGLRPLEVSIGDYVLSGGEVPAMVVADAVVRLLPGALGDAESVRVESFSRGLLDYPQYTRPVEFRGMAVPEVLLSGDHARIAAWREQEARRRTGERRPDLLPENDEERES